MTEPQEYFRETKISRVFHEPTLSDIISGVDGEASREFLAVGQKSVQVLTSDPEMGGGSINKLEYQGSVGMVDLGDSEHAYMYVQTVSDQDEINIIEEMPRTAAQAHLKNPDACGKFVVASLQAALETFQAKL